MDVLTKAVEWLHGIAWGPPMLVLLLGVGLYLTFGLRLRMLGSLPLAIAMLWRGRVPEGSGEITPL